MTSPDHRRTAPLIAGAVRRVALLAEREFVAYVGTVTFWIALALGPISMVAVVGLTAIGGSAPPATPAGAQTISISVDAEDPSVGAATVDALRAASELMERPITVVTRRDAARLSVARRDGRLVLDLQPVETFPPIVRAFILDRVSLQTQCGIHNRRCLLPPAGVDVSHPTAQPAVATHGPRAGASAPSVGRVAVATLLWLTLTGSLGMLLQAVVRERTNRGLETLLAVASPLEIVLGKLAGVGAVSCLVTGAWIGAGAGLAAITSHRGGLVSALLSGLSQPADILRSTLCFVLAYVSYGLATVAIGSKAGDTAAAQNMSRPLFAVLMIVFLAVTASASGGAAALTWLVFLPPFTPFLLITGDYSPVQELSAVGLTIIAIAIAGLAAHRATRLKA